MKKYLLLILFIKGGTVSACSGWEECARQRNAEHEAFKIQFPNDDDGYWFAGVYRGPRRWQNDRWE